MTQRNVLLVPGSLRSGSHTTHLLRAAGELLPGSKGAIKAVTWLRDTLIALGAVVVGEPVAIADVVNTVRSDGSYVDEVQDQLHALVSALVETLTEV